MKKTIVGLVIAGLLVLFVYTIYYLWGKEQQEPIVYETEQAFKTSIIKKTMATGAVVPRKEIDIKPQVSGIIQEIYVEAGELVKKGDLIAKVKIIPDMVTLNNAENRVNRAKIALDQAKRDYDRNKQLLDQGVIPEVEFQTFEIALKNAEEEQEAAASNLQLIREGVTKRSGRSTNTLIRSTIDGMVLDVPVKEGNSVIESNTFNEGTTIASVADMGNMIFEGNVDESEVNKIKLGMPLILNIGAIETEKFDASLEYISPKGVTIDGAIQFEIRAALKIDTTGGSFIRAGYSASADIVLDRRDDVLAIRESLMQFDDTGKSYIEVEVGDQRFERRDLTTGLSDGINIEVLSGVTEADKIKQPNTELDGGPHGGH